MEFQWYQLLIPLVAAAIGYYARHLIEKRKELQGEVNKERRGIYQKFVDLVVNDLARQPDPLLDPAEVSEKNTDSAADAQELSDANIEIFAFLKKYMLYASPDVINAFGEYRQYVFQEAYYQKEISTKTQYELLSRVISEMREDLGLSNKKLGHFGERTFKAVLIDYKDYFLS